MPVVPGRTRRRGTRERQEKRHAGGMRDRRPGCGYPMGLAPGLGSGTTFRRWQVIAAAVMLGRMTDVTRVLSAIEQGEPYAAEQLLPLVYDELRKLAAA